jgi:hypothetical protein
MRSVGLILLAGSLTYPVSAAAADPSWRAPEHWVRVHGAITPLYSGEVRGDDGYGTRVSNPLLFGVGAQYLYRIERNMGFGVGARYFAIRSGESCSLAAPEVGQAGPAEVCVPGHVFGHELMVPLLLAIVAPWAKGFDSDLTLGLGYAGAWVPGPFTAERQLADGLYAEAGVGASWEVTEGLDASLRATVVLAGTGGQAPNDRGYAPGYGFLQAGLPFELGVRKRW